MKANELMIGDWVRMHYPFDIDLDRRFEKILILDKDIDIDCEPIPLTAEILKKNGFKYFLQSYHWKNEREMPIKLRWLKSFWCLEINCDSIPVELRFVHELQHALRLCHINKDIIL